MRNYQLFFPFTGKEEILWYFINNKICK